MTDRIGVAVIGAGDGKQTMDFVFTTDIARANLRAAEVGVTDADLDIGTSTDLGWKPEVDLHSGLRELVAWWRSERSEGVGS
jgi:UDP-glucose 4-epimerase